MDGESWRIGISFKFENSRKFEILQFDIFRAIFNPLNRLARDQRSRVVRIPVGGRDSRRTTSTESWLKAAWALARAWHLASARLGTLALGPYVWERRLSGFRPTHGRRFRANNCLPFSLSLSSSVFLPTIHSFDIFSTTFFLFSLFFFTWKIIRSDITPAIRSFTSFMEKQGNILLFIDVTWSYL